LALLEPSILCTESKLGTDTRPDNLPRHIPTLFRSAGIDVCESFDYPLKAWPPLQVNPLAAMSKSVECETAHARTDASPGPRSASRTAVTRTARSASWQEAYKARPIQRYLGRVSARPHSAFHLLACPLPER